MRHLPDPVRAYLMLLIDPRWPEPKVVDARIMSDGNPTTRSGCFWASLAGFDAVGRDFEEAHRQVEKLVATAPHLEWVRKVMARVESASRHFMRERQHARLRSDGIQPSRRARVVGRSG